jgi:DnaJ-class molecular chaperone
MASRQEWATFGLDQAAATVPALKSRYRALAAKLHPDHGGSAEAFAALSKLYHGLLEELETTHTCPACRGLKVINVRGFYRLGQRCTLCHGTGKVGWR